VNDRKFLNQAQPQTLVIATMLLYVNAVFGVITFYPLLMAIGVAMFFGGYGIANEKRWGYGVAVGAAIINLALLIFWWRGALLEFPGVLNLLFDGALVALLVHPESRDYQRIWFR
jgi:hypothetical protein